MSGMTTQTVVELRALLPEVLEEVPCIAEPCAAVATHFVRQQGCTCWPSVLDTCDEHTEWCRSFKAWGFTCADCDGFVTFLAIWKKNS